MQEDLKNQIATAVHRAIEAVGMEAFKRTSMFGRNNPEAD